MAARGCRSPTPRSRPRSSASCAEREPSVRKRRQTAPRRAAGREAEGQSFFFAVLEDDELGDEDEDDDDDEPLESPPDPDPESESTFEGVSDDGRSLLLSLLSERSISRWRRLVP